MDVVHQGDLAQDVDLVRLDRVARALVEAVEPARPRAALAGGDVPLDPPLLGRASLHRQEGPGRVAPCVHVADALLDGRADVAGLGIEELVSEHEGIPLDCDDPALDVHDVADPQLADVAHVAIGGDAEAPTAPGIGGAEPERIEQDERGVAEPGEIERDRQVVVVVDLPAVDDPAVRLEPVVHDVFLLEAMGDAGPAIRVSLHESAPAGRRVLSW